jgi:hypothetical protein
MGKHSRKDGEQGSSKQGKGKHVKSERGSTDQSNRYRPFTEETLWERITGKGKK